MSASTSVESLSERQWLEDLRDRNLTQGFKSPLG